LVGKTRETAEEDKEKKGTKKKRWIVNTSKRLHFNKTYEKELLQEEKG